MDRILVPFHGDGAGEDELTWGQVGLWHGMATSGRSMTMAGIAPLSPDMTIERVADLLSFIVGRHQALRTRLRFRPNGRPLQVCVTDDEVPLEIIDTDDPKAVETRYRTVNFDYEHEFPMRMAVIRQNGALTHLVGVYLHLALDAGGLTALLADIAARDPVTGEAGPVTGIQPLAQARNSAPRGRGATVPPR